MHAEEISKEKFHFGKITEVMSFNDGKNKEVLEAVKRTEEELSRFPEFIGVFPFYSSIKGNDDKAIIDSEDSMKGSEHNLYMYILGDKNFKEGNRVNERLNRIGTEYEQKGINIQFVEHFFSKEEISDLLIKIDTVNQSDYYIWTFANLFRSGRGEKIFSLRNMIKNEFLKMQNEKKEKIFDVFIDWLVLVDKKSTEKVTKKSDIYGDVYLNARRELWTKRLHKIF